jgi:heterodisulfide reductase subunit A
MSGPEIETNGQPKIGVYVCHCGINIANKVNVEKVVEFARTLPNVTIAREYKFMCSDPGQDLIKEDIRSGNVNRAIVASCSPLMHERTFRAAVADAGENQFFFHMANIREHVSWVTEDGQAATDKAKALIAAAVRRIALNEPLEKQRVPVHPDALVVGGGIAGIHAAITMADAGKKVYLVERNPSIGGHMAKFDKTFPTLDCAACILTPKMTDVRAHPNIELLSYSEITNVGGYVGNFKVQVRKNPRYVLEEKCNACGECVDSCPVTMPSEFDLGLGNRHAIYLPFPQAVPMKFTIDKKGVSPCRIGCPAGVNAHGYIALISQKKFTEAMELIRRDLPFPTVCGYVCHHPCEKECNRKEFDDETIAICALKRFVADTIRTGDEGAVEPIVPDKKEKIAIIGAGPSGLTCALKLLKLGYKTTVFDAESKPGGMIRTCLPEYRIPEDALDYDVEHIAAHGIEMKPNTLIGKTVTLDELMKTYQAVYVAIGLQHPAKLGLEGSDAPGVIYGLNFLKEARAGKTSEGFGKHVIIIGGGSVAMDCAKTAIRRGAESVDVVCLETRDCSHPDGMVAHPWEIEEAEEEGVCIHPSLGPKRIVRERGKIAGLDTITCIAVYDEDRRFAPKFDEDREAPTIKGDTVIIAIGQRSDLSGLEKIQSEGGLLKVDKQTLQTSVPNVFAGGDIVRGPASVIEAVADGNRAALSIDRYIRGEPLAFEEDQPHIVEIDEVNTERAVKKKRTRIKKTPVPERKKDFRQIELTLSEKEAIDEALRCLNCAGCSECTECEKHCEPEAIDYAMKEEVVEVDVGTIILSTGFETFDASRIARFGYGRYPNVYTSLEVERLLNAAGPTSGEVVLRDGSKPKRVGIIHCVGSRDDNYHSYCSKVCCMYSLKIAHLMKEKTESEVYNFYIDMRTPGKGYEEFYERLLNEGMHLIRGRVAEVTDWAMTEEEEGKLVIRAEDTLIGAVRRVPVDMVVLSVGLEARADADEVRRMFNISCSSDGWFLERHPKLAPVSTFTDGIFLAGACQGPKDIPESVAQAGAAASQALALIDRGYVELEPNTAFIDEDACSGCKTCISLCPFTAIGFNDEKGVSEINEALCKGCGTCVAACPSGVAQQHLFLDEQIFEEIRGLLSYV